MDYTVPIWLSLKCALFSALLNLPWGLGWGWVLSRCRFAGRGVLETLLTIPLVLPPVLTGYFLLVVLSKKAPVGRLLWETFGYSFVLDWKGAVVAATVVSSPFMVQMCREAFSAVDVRLEQAARTLGAGRWRVLRTVTLPLAFSGILSGFCLTFARSIGEFGATIILAGNIPGKTQTIPLAIYNQVLLGKEENITPLILAAIVAAYAGLGASYYMRKRHAV